MSEPVIRAAQHADLARVLELVHELAAYEHAPDAVEATEPDFAAALFPFHGHPTTFCHVAEVDGQVVGIAVWYLTFSTWTGTNGIWLEDLYVTPERRGGGVGRALIAGLAAECVRRGYRRLEWWVLRWNEQALRFYRGLGAEPQDEWSVQRLDGDALARLGGAR